MPKYNEGKSDKYFARHFGLICAILSRKDQNTSNLILYMAESATLYQDLMQVRETVFQVHSEKYKFLHSSWIDLNKNLYVRG